MLEAGNIYKYEKFIIYKLTIFLKPHPKIISLWLNGLRKHFVKFNRMGIGAPELLQIKKIKNLYIEIKFYKLDFIN